MIRSELNQTQLKGGQRLPLRLLKNVLSQVAKELRVKKDTLVSVAFVDKKMMRRLNKQYRGKDKVTDVLSFGLDDNESLGELILSYDQARIQAKEMGHSVRDEIVFLIVHGMLHLYGHDHEKTSEAKLMFERQTRILKKLKVDPRI